MFRLVCYDVASPKRLKKVAKVCESYGIRIQKSCFQADVENKEKFKNLIDAITLEMDRKKDSLVVYSVCDDCNRLAVAIGPTKIIDPDEVVFL
mgnify:CR=1 FL=1